MKRKYTIYSDKVWVEGKLQPASVSIEGGKISDIFLEKKMDNAKDFSGKVVMPGAIDAHVHINEPGKTEWEGFETATKAAATGGITTVIDMPLNSSPVVTTVSAFKEKLKASKYKLFVNCGFWAGAIDDSVEEVKALIKEGCLGVKVFLSHSGIDEFPKINLNNLARLMDGVKDLNVPILAHCELDTLPFDSNLKYKPTSYQEYLNSRPKSWENEAVKKFIQLSQQYNCKTHVVHLASEEILEWLQEMKNQKVPFTVETCTHYLLFNAEEIEDGNTLFKCAPPIRGKKTSDQLKQALQSGLIDFVSSDHSPAPAEIKEIESGDFTKAWGGIAGLQFLLSGSWTALKDEMSLENFIPLLTSKPAMFLGLQNRIGKIEKGFDANITIWEPEQIFKVLEKNIAHKHKITPYLNLNLFGKINQTIVNGEVAFQNEKVSLQPFGMCL